MTEKEKLIPANVAALIIGWLNTSLSEEEGDELDRWISESDENLELYEALTANANPVSDFDELKPMIEELDTNLLLASIIRADIDTDERVSNVLCKEFEEPKYLFWHLLHPSNRLKVLEWAKEPGINK